MRVDGAQSAVCPKDVQGVQCVDVVENPDMLGWKWQKVGSWGQSHNQAGDCSSEVPDNNYTEELSVKKTTGKVMKIKEERVTLT